MIIGLSLKVMCQSCFKNTMLAFEQQNTITHNLYQTVDKTVV